MKIGIQMRRHGLESTRMAAAKGEMDMERGEKELGWE
jgi:hypothetical protein